MDTSKLVHEAEVLYEQGNHEEAVARLTSALKSGNTDRDAQKIEELINKLGLHIFENGANSAESSSRGISSGGERGIGTQLASSFFSPSGSSSAQLGKLAMLGTVLAGNQKSSGGGLQAAMSLLSGHHQSSGGSNSGWASLASKFFGGGNQGQAPVSGGYGGQAHQDTSTFSKLSSMASSYMSNQGGQSAGQSASQYGNGYGPQEGHYGGGYAQAASQHGAPYGSQGGSYGGGYTQAGYGGPGGSGASHSKLSTVASMANNYLSGHGNTPNRTDESSHSASGGGHSDGLSSLASVASNIMGHGKGRHEPPSAYGNPNMGDNGFSFTGGSHFAPL